jgi:protein-disulfide isomerase
MLATVVALAFAAPVSSQTFSEEDIKRMALEAILENPQIVMDAVEILREREEAAEAKAQSQGWEDNKQLLTTDLNAPVLGNPDGDVTIVEFFDYNCGYCKHAMVAMKAVLEKDKNVRVVYREFPILSQGSVFAAQAALASREQGKYEEFHWALMSAQSVDESSVMQIAQSIGLDLDKLRIDMESPEVAEHIQTSRDTADALQFTGTPSFVIGDEIVGGYVPEETIVEIIAAERES